MTTQLMLELDADHILPDRDLLNDSDFDVKTGETVLVEDCGDGTWELLERQNLRKSEEKWTVIDREFDPDEEVDDYFSQPTKIQSLWEEPHRNLIQIFTGDADKTVPSSKEVSYEHLMDYGTRLHEQVPGEGELIFGGKPADIRHVAAVISIFLSRHNKWITPNGEFRTAPKEFTDHAALKHAGRILKDREEVLLPNGETVSYEHVTINEPEEENDG